MDLGGRNADDAVLGLLLLLLHFRAETTARWVVSSWRVGVLCTGPTRDNDSTARAGVRENGRYGTP
jgi:hypothetical protein